MKRVLLILFLLGLMLASGAAGYGWYLVQQPYRTHSGSQVVDIPFGVGSEEIVDLLVARARAIVVPFSTASETEQTLRSHLLQKRGLVTVIQDAELSAQLLAKAITDVTASQRPQQSRIALDGAARSADILYDLAMDARKN